MVSNLFFTIYIINFHPDHIIQKMDIVVIDLKNAKEPMFYFIFSTNLIIFTFILSFTNILRNFITLIDHFNFYIKF